MTTLLFGSALILEIVAAKKLNSKFREVVTQVLGQGMVANESKSGKRDQFGFGIPLRRISSKPQGTLVQ